MFFLNLSIGEFFALLGTLGGVVTALYLLDKSRRKKTVSTLRFWPGVKAVDVQTSRKRMQQPWSLLLQLLSLTLLLLAIAQLQWGHRGGRSRDHVLLLDTSVWSGAKTASGSVLDQERHLALRYLANLPSQDRVMLVRVDALSSPATPFTANHEQINTALLESASNLSSLNLPQALSFARRAQSEVVESGEITYIGPKRIAENQSVEPTPLNLRILSVPVSLENASICNMSVRRGDNESNSWEAVVTIKNQGRSPRRLNLRTQFAGTKFAPRTYVLSAGEELPVKYNFVTNTAGRLLAEIDSDDSLSSDNHAELQLPANKNLTVIAYTQRRELLRPLFEINRHMSIRYVDPSRYAAHSDADLVFLDGFAPPQLPAVSSIWLNPPKEHTPLPVKTVVRNGIIKSWHGDNTLQTGLHAREDRIGETAVFQLPHTATAVADVTEGPVIAAINDPVTHSRSVIIGFDPFTSDLRYSVTTPLLFANLLRWLTPEAFRDKEFTAGRVGSTDVALAPGETPNQLHVTDQRGFLIPFSVQERTLQLFVDQPKVLHVVADTNYERTLSLTLPDVVEGQWTPPAKVTTGLPAPFSTLPSAVDLWKWLACLGGLGIFIEWWLFGGSRRWMAKRVEAASTRTKRRKESQQQKELLTR